MSMLLTCTLEQSEWHMQGASRAVGTCVGTIFREVRRLYPDRVLPSIFVSSNCRTEHIVDGLDAGAQDYMTKPVNKEELIARVRAHLRLQDVVRPPPLLRAALLGCLSSTVLLVVAVSEQQGGASDNPVVAGGEGGLGPCE
jgi:DNA-binding NtrC family response regulator